MRSNHMFYLSDGGEIELAISIRVINFEIRWAFPFFATLRFGGYEFFVFGSVWVVFLSKLLTASHSDFFNHHVHDLSECNSTVIILRECLKCDALRAAFLRTFFFFRLFIPQSIFWPYSWNPALRCQWILRSRCLQRVLRRLWHISQLSGLILLFRPRWLKCTWNAFLSCPCSGLGGNFSRMSGLPLLFITALENDTKLLLNPSFEILLRIVRRNQ